MPVPTDLNIIDPDPNQPRMQCKEAAISEIAISAKKHGIINAITVRQHPDDTDRWMIVHGETRWRAAKKAGLKTIPASLATPEEVNDHISRIMLQAADNLSSPLSPIDWGHMYSTLKKTGLNAKQIEEKMIEHGLHRHGQSAIKNLIRIAEDSPRWMISLIESDIITTTHAKIMLNLSDEILLEVREWLKTHHRPSVTALETRVLHLYMQRHPILRDHEVDISSCSGCTTKKNILKNAFCLNPTCYLSKRFECANKPDLQQKIEPPIDDEIETQQPPSATEYMPPAERNENQEGMFKEIRELNQNAFSLDACQPCSSRISITGTGKRNYCDSPSCWDDSADAARDLKLTVVQWIIKQLEIYFENHPFDAYSFLNWSHLACPIIKKGKITFRHPLSPPKEFELKRNLTLATTPATDGAQQIIATALIQNLTNWTTCQRTADIGRELVKTYNINPPKQNDIDLPVFNEPTDIAWAWDQLTGADQ